MSCCNIYGMERLFKLTTWVNPSPELRNTSLEDAETEILIQKITARNLVIDLAKKSQVSDPEYSKALEAKASSLTLEIKRIKKGLSTLSRARGSIPISLEYGADYPLADIRSYNYLQAVRVVSASLKRIKSQRGKEAA